NLSGDERGPTVSLPADADDLHVLLRIEPKPSKGHPGNEIRARPNLPNPNSLPLEIFGPLDIWERGQEVVQPVPNGTAKLKLLDTLGPRSHYRGSTLQLQKQVARERGLDAQQPAPDIDRLDL